MKFTVFQLLLITTFFAASVFGQEAPPPQRCLTKEEAARVIARFDSGQKPAANENLQRELLKMREQRTRLETKMLENLDKGGKLLAERTALSKAQFARVCQIVRENGWLTDEMVKPEGVSAALLIISNNREFDWQAEMLEVLVRAANKNLVPKGEIAGIVDNIRVGKGAPQIFGTQAKIKDNVVYIYPLLNEANLAEWRKQYDLPPMADYIKQLERRFTMPVLKMSRPARMPNAKNETQALGVAGADEEEVLKVDTKLVNLNVRVLRQSETNADDLALKQEDFAIYENGEEQQISFFSNADQPIDLVMVLDFSGSTEGKQGLIKKAAERFVELARPTDRIAVVAFTHEIQVISDLTENRARLAESIKNIEIKGGSRIWDALKFTYQNIIAKQAQGRRSAVIFMTDGLDGSLNTTFADLLEMVRQGETTVFPVYLDPSDSQLPQTSRMAEKSLSLLAEASGGELHPAKNVKNLVAIYERIIQDLSRVYSISYEPKDEIRDGSWRTLEIKVKSQPNLIVRSRAGYYAN